MKDLTFKDISHKGKCNVCGKETNVVTFCSWTGALSLAYCEDCAANYYEPYGDILTMVSCCGEWPNDIKKSYQDLIRKNLVFHNKTEEEFIEDLKKYY